MNLLTFKNLEGDNIDLNVPENLKEITFGQLIELQKQDLTDIQVLSILCGVPVDELYSINYDDLIRQGKIFIDLFNHGSLAIDYTLPPKISVLYAGKTKAIKLGNYLSIRPAGAYVAAAGVIGAEVRAYIEALGEDYSKLNFQLSYENCAQVVDEFLYCQVTGGPWIEKGPERQVFANNLNAQVVLSIAKYFYNKYPKLINVKPANRLLRLFKKPKPEPVYDFTN